jgi:hypothetical protein
MQFICPGSGKIEQNPLRLQNQLQDERLTLIFQSIPYVRSASQAKIPKVLWANADYST